jgi:hypothetical protein
METKWFFDKVVFFQEQETKIFIASPLIEQTFTFLKWSFVILWIKTFEYLSVRSQLGLDDICRREIDFNFFCLFLPLLKAMASQ